MWSPRVLKPHTFVSNEVRLVLPAEVSNLNTSNFRVANEANQFLVVAVWPQ